MNSKNSKGQALYSEIFLEEKHFEVVSEEVEIVSFIYM